MTLYGARALLDGAISHFLVPKVSSVAIIYKAPHASAKRMQANNLQKCNEHYFMYNLTRGSGGKMVVLAFVGQFLALLTVLVTGCKLGLKCPPPHM